MALNHIRFTILDELPPTAIHWIRTATGSGLPT